MKRLLNTLYIMSEDVYLTLDGENVVAKCGEREMSISERNAILKTILEKIEYRKGKNGNIEIDLYPKLPKK